MRSAAAGAVVTGALLVAAIVVVPDRLPLGNACPDRLATTYMSKRLPKDAVIAGDPRDLMCVPATARRPVVISTQLAPAYEADYFRHGRERMFATLRAYYGHSSAAIADLGRRYGADYLWVRRDNVERERAGGGVRWRSGSLPYGRYVRQLLRSGEPAVLHLPVACRRWRLGQAEVYDIDCIAAGAGTASSGGPDSHRTSAIRRQRPAAPAAALRGLGNEGRLPTRRRGRPNIRSRERIRVNND